LFNSDPINDGVWHHLAAAVDGQTLELYLDGVLIASTSVGTNVASSQPVLIGKELPSGPWPRYFKGWIDEVRIYDRALEANEVTLLYGEDGADEITSPGAYSIPHLPIATNYTVTAFMDSNGNGIQDTDEAFGSHADNPVPLTNDVTGIDIQLEDAVFYLDIGGAPSEHGVPLPHEYGVHEITARTVVTNTVDSTADESNGVRYACVGWTGTGSVPSSGSGNSVSFALTNDSALTWHWDTEYYLDTETGAGGTVDVGDGWRANGETVAIGAAADAGYVFDAWTGDVPAGHENDNPLTVVMDQKRDITATFITGVTNGLSIVEVAHIGNGGGALTYDVMVHSNYAYTADGYGGLRAIDVSDPENPSVAGHIDSGGHAVFVVVRGDYAYLGNAMDGLRIYDISSPQSPTPVGHVDDFAGHVAALDVVGDYAYVGYNATPGFRIYDVSNPASPTHVGHANDIIDSVLGIQAIGDHAYLGGDYEGLLTYDVSNPTNPVRVAMDDQGGRARRLDVVGNYLYLANSDDGVRIYDISNPASPALAGHVPDGEEGASMGVHVVDGRMHVANRYSGLWVYDASSPTNPLELAHIDDDSGGLARDVYASGDYTCVANETDGLRIYEAGAGFYLDSEAQEGGTVGAVDGWYSNGVSVAIPATPAPNHSFAGWEGDIPAGSESDNPLTVVMDSNRDIVAQFAEVDSDGDGMSDGDEFVCGTSATDPNEVLQMTGLSEPDVDGNVVLEWDTVEGMTYTVSWSTNLMLGFQVLATGIVGDADGVSFTNQYSGNEPHFYRIEPETYVSP